MEGQQFSQLKLKFIQLDTDGDGFINKAELQHFMKKQKLFNIPAWKINQALFLIDNKMSQQNFVIWIMGCRVGLQDMACAKFELSKKLKNLESAGPPASPSKIKKSSLNFQINDAKQSKQTTSQHFLKVQFGLDKQSANKKFQQLKQVLGHDPAQINLFIKIKTDNNGQQIAQKFQQLIQLGITLLSQLGPSATTVIQAIQATSKWHEGYVYIILELNHSFFNILLNYLEEALNQLSPECKFLLKLRIVSDFTKVLNQNFNPLSQSINLGATFQIDGTSLSKLKQNLLEDFDKKKEDDKAGIMFAFLLEQINLQSSFQNIKQCFQSLGLAEQAIPKPAAYTNQIKNIQIKQLASQFLPDVGEFFDQLQNNCHPQGQIVFNIKHLGLKLKFKLNIEGAFHLL